MEKFCAVCGKTTDKTIKGMCIPHYLEKNPVLVVPDEIPIDTDKTTFSVRYREKWVQPDEKAVFEIIKSRLKTRDIVNPQLVVLPTSIQNRFLVVVQGKISGVDVEAKKFVSVKPVLVQSDAEMRLKSSYHEAIIQLRYREKKELSLVEAALANALEMLSAEKKRDSLAGVSGITRHRSGIDLLIGSKSAAKKVIKKLAKKYNSPVSVSFKIVGQNKSGKEKKRFTYCIRV